MGAILDKEGVVRKQDLQPYISTNQASSLFEPKAPVEDPYLRSSVANTRYEAKGTSPFWKRFLTASTTSLA